MKNSLIGKTKKSLLEVVKLSLVIGYLVTQLGSLLCYLRDSSRKNFMF